MRTPRPARSSWTGRLRNSLTPSRNPPSRAGPAEPAAVASCPSCSLVTRAGRTAMAGARRPAAAAVMSVTAAARLPGDGSADSAGGALAARQRLGRIGQVEFPPGAERVQQLGPDVEPAVGREDDVDAKRQAGG